MIKRVQIVDKNKNKILGTSSMILEQERGIEVKKLNGCPRSSSKRLLKFEIFAEIFSVLIVY